MYTFTRVTLLIFVLPLLVLLSSCTSDTSEAVVEVDIDVTDEPQPVETVEPATATPEPTDTPAPTDTPEPPTDTPEPPTDTPTEEPTDTAESPTDIPTEEPTDAPEAPTDTPTEEPTEESLPTNTVTAEDTPTPAPAAPAATPTSEASAAVAHFQQGIQYYEQEAYNDAIAEFQEVINLEPEFDVVYAYLGYSYVLGPQDFEQAIEALETYLQLNPEAEDKAQVEQDIQLLREALVSQGDTQFDIPPGKSLFVFKNYSGEIWSVDIGPYHLDVPTNPPDQEYSYHTLVIDPGTYTWQAHSMGGGYYITDSSGNKAFEFTVAPDEMYGTQCCR